jgi:Ni/Fe-hydrogenase subunit HybB-like protein
MQLSFTPIKGTSRKYKVLVAVLAVLALTGIVAYMVSYLEGFRLWGINNSVSWGQLITVDIFFIGLSAGSLVVSSLVYVFGQERYKPIGRMAVFMGLLLMIGAMVCVLTDLGRPEKMWRLFMYGYLSNMKSMFAVNGIFYAGYIGLLVAYLAAALANSKLIKVIAPVAVLWAILVHMGTGAIFGFIETRGIMYSPLKPVEFISAAFASGLALVMLLSYVTLKLGKRPISKDMYVSLGRMLIVLIIVLVVLVVTDKLTHFYPPARESLLFLTQGPWSWIFWGMQVTMGYVIPLIILCHPKWGKTVKGIMIACLICVIGIFGERMGIIFPGLSQPLQYYPGEIEGVWGARGGFPIMPAETLMTVGIFSLLGLMYVLGLKFLQLLPTAGSEGTADEGSEATAEQKALAAEGGTT